MADRLSAQPPSAVDRPRGSIWRDFNGAAVWAGLTAFVWYAFGTVPLHLAVASQLGLDAARTSSWVFIVWFSGAVASIALSLTSRQPIPITWSIPGLVYLGTLAGRFSFPEIVGANLLAGVLIVALGLLGVGARILAWLPLPIALGMFAGSIVGYVTRLVEVTVADAAIAGAATAGYLVGRWLNRPQLPPVALAVLFGAVGVLVTQRTEQVAVSWTLPTLVLTGPLFTLPAFIAVSLPMVVLAFVMGNVQGLGFLLAQGYRVAVDRVTVVVGVNSVINALFGGHTAIVARTGVAILASSEAGPASGRYWANLIAAMLTLLIAIAAAPLASLLAVLPASYIVALAGLAILPSFQDALEKAFKSEFRFGAVVAFAVAATPFSLLGVTSAFWAIMAGVVASLAAERTALLAHVRGTKNQDG